MNDQSVENKARNWLENCERSNTWNVLHKRRLAYTCFYCVRQYQIRPSRNEGIAAWQVLSQYEETRYVFKFIVSCILPDNPLPEVYGHLSWFLGRPRERFSRSSVGCFSVKATWIMLLQLVRSYVTYLIRVWIFRWLVMSSTSPKKNSAAGVEKYNKMLSIWVMYKNSKLGAVIHRYLADSILCRWEPQLNSKIKEETQLELLHTVITEIIISEPKLYFIIPPPRNNTENQFSYTDFSFPVMNNQPELLFSPTDCTWGSFWFSMH